MKPTGTLIAERPLAQHSELLVARPPDVGELAKALAGKAGRLESALAHDLADLLGGARPAITCGKVEKAASPKLHKIIDPVAANFLLAGQGSVQVIASVDYHSALVLTDQVFGGAGDWAGTRPDRLPASASLTLQRMIDVLGKSLAALFDLSEAMTLAARSDVLGKFVAARDNDTFLALRIEVSLGDARPWSVLLVLREGHAAQLLDERQASAPAPKGVGDRRRPDARPFADVPLPLTAVLARLSMPVSRISALQVGDTIPLAIGRNVSLRLADREIARGEVGTCDGALALRLTSIAWNSPSKGPNQ